MATVARNKQDVDSMDTKQRLWDSLQNSYGVKKENTEQAYDKAISQADRQSLSRGMQRSSYNNQVLGNLNNQRAKALGDIDSEMIADYENRLQNIEEAEAARAFQTSEREAQQNWQSAENELARAFQTKEREAQQVYNTGEREAQQAWQSGENALTLDEKKRQFDLSFGQSNDQYDKSLAVSWVQSLLASGQMPTDDLLAQAGLSKENAQAMLGQSANSGYAGSSGSVADYIKQGFSDYATALQARQATGNKKITAAEWAASPLNPANQTNGTNDDAFGAALGAAYGASQTGSGSGATLPQSGKDNGVNSIAQRATQGALNTRTRKNNIITQRQ